MVREDTNHGGGVLSGFVCLLACCFFFRTKKTEQGKLHEGIGRSVLRLSVVLEDTNHGGETFSGS